MYHLSFLSLDKYGDIYIIILGRLRKKIKKILDKIKKMGIIKVEKNKRREVKMYVRVRFQTKIGGKVEEEEIIRKVNCDGTINVGFAVIPVKEIRKWFNRWDMKVIKISNIEGRQ